MLFPDEMIFRIILLIALAAYLIFYAVSFIKKRRIFAHRSNRASATVTHFSLWKTLCATKFTYTMEYIIRGKRQTATFRTRFWHKVGETVEIAYLQEDPERVMLSEDFADTIANKVSGAIHVAICVFLLVVLSYIALNYLEIANKTNKEANKEVFFKLCLIGAPQQVEEMIKAGADVNAKDNNGNTPLILAVMNNNPDVSRLLIKKGADVNAKNKEGATPLTLAAISNNPEVFRMFIQVGAEVNDKSDGRSSPLMYAARNSKNPEVFRMLIQEGADVNYKNSLNSTPLMYAAMYNNNPEVLSVLIQSGADVNAKNNKGETALNLAMRRITPEIVSFLLATGTVSKKNVLELAQKEILSLLLASGATVSENDLELAQKNESLKNTAIIEEMKKNLLTYSHD